MANESGQLEIDYSTDARRVVAKVYDQGDCKTGWAYAMVGQLEGQEWASGLLEGDRVEPKSKQQLIRCQGFDYRPTRDHLTDQVSEYLMKNSLALEIDIPKPRWGCLVYPNKCPLVRWCTTYKLEDVALKRDFVTVLNGFDGNVVELVLREYGPVAFFMETWDDVWDGDDLTFGEQADRTRLVRHHHAILLVGFGTAADGVKFFKFKNSLGSEWGHKGYGYIRRSNKAKPVRPMSGTIQLFRLKGC